MSSGFNSPTPIADGSTYYVTFSAGTVQLYHLEEVSVSDEGNVELVTGPAGVVGSRRSAGGFKISIKTNRAKGVAEEVPWQRLRRADEVFRFEEQILGGTRQTYNNCRVANVNTSTGADGAVTMDVTLVCTDQDEVGV
jgi:hypothetical protein